MTYKNFGWLSAAALLLTTSCSDQTAFSEAPGQIQPEGTTMTFTISPQLQAWGTRAADWTISEGALIDQLIYAVYEVTEVEGKEVLSISKDFGNLTDAQGNNTGQVSLSVTKAQYPYKISLLFSEDMIYNLDDDGDIDTSSPKKYKIAFWAQKSGTGYYDTSDLQKVKVNYSESKTADGGTTTSNYLNNDETRDAFCGVSETFTVSGVTKEVTLKRPFAQVNVGTAGWDYEGAAILKPSPVSYTESTITLKGVAQYYDVINGVALVTEDTGAYPKTNVTFAYSTIPAFIHLSAEELEEIGYTPVDDEEPLRIDMNGDEEISPYVSWSEYKNWSLAHQDATELPSTETFKYLSMSYVLVPGGNYKINDKGEVEADATNTATGGVLDEITFSAQGYVTSTTVNDDGEEVEVKEMVPYEAFTITQVPVQKNWRTNIVGYNLFTIRTKFNLYVVPTFMGDFNDVNGTNKGDAYEDWHNVTIEESDPDDKGNTKWELIYPDNGTIGDPNPDFDHSWETEEPSVETPDGNND